METARCSICGAEHPVADMVTGHKEPRDVPADAEEAFPEPRDWWLANADQLHARHPRSYFIPPGVRRRALRTGELIKLEFTYGPHADREQEGHVERMWVEVLEQRPDGRAEGRLRNQPIRLAELAIGDRVAFGPEHVITIDYTDEELGYPQSQSPIADPRIVDDDTAPYVAVRAPGPYTADEDEWWMLVRDQPERLITESANSLTDRFPGLVEPLRAGEGLWEHAGGEGTDARWRRVPADEIEASEDWRALFAWLDGTAEMMRRG
ncbi:MAG TPA: DUF2314 domain-containing protein [Solirubrobacteraceae bacterium]|nr:DUF2314 domain-containing protein [Solirubrobacteraceae bacterium]